MPNAIGRPREPSVVKGRNDAGAIPCSNARTGNSVFGCINMSAGSNDASNFESTISVDGQIRQTSSADLSGNEYLIGSSGNRVGDFGGS
jgi:hypothetical protein